MPARPFREARNLVKRKLDGVPPSGFDCSSALQNRFLYDWAWADQRQRLTTTYVYHHSGIFAAYASVCMDALILGTREKPAALRYKHIAGLKPAQLAVHHTFHGRGLGTLVVFDVVRFALNQSRRMGCRYVTLDAQPDLVGWYEGLGFEVNKLVQKQRIAAAVGRTADEIPVSMRFDLREA